MALRALLIFVLCSAAMAAGGRWRVQYAHQGKAESLRIADLKFASSRRGVAVGDLMAGRRSRSVALLTGDGGGSWEMVPLAESPLSLFLLNERVGWVVTAKGVWKTADSGRNWRRLPGNRATSHARRVWFQDENSGWLVGSQKSIFHTSDGGRLWTPVPEAGQVASTPRYTTFDWIVFNGGRTGVIAGASIPPRRGSAAARETPQLTILLQTADGGVTWQASTASMFGRVSRVVFGGGRGLMLIRFGRGMDFPSEVFAMDGAGGQIRRAFRRADCAVTDVAFLTSGTALLVGVDAAAKGDRQLLPSAVRVLSSDDLREWKEMEVEGPCSAHSVVLSVVDPGCAWLATDTGVILRLERRQ